MGQSSTKAVAVVESKPISKDPQPDIQSDIK